MNQIKNYIGFSRDHSASMRGIARAAAKSYNSNISAIKESAIAHNQDTIVSVVKCGFGSPARNEFEVINSNVQTLTMINEHMYNANGSSTPLFDSIGDLIDCFKAVPDAAKETVSFLIMSITDGFDNSSKKWTGKSLAAEIQRLQATDRWTFVFRVPRGGSSELIAHGIPAGNILEWDQTEQGVEISTKATDQAMGNFYAGRSIGKTSTQTFYADLKDVSSTTVKTKLEDISTEVSIWPVLQTEDSSLVREFCEKRLGTGMLKGAAFYQLTKLEKKVQDYKQIVIRDKKTQMIYGGTAARDLLGLPHVGDVKLAPGNFGGFDVFIQSTSVNRKLPAGSFVLYWPKVGTAFIEGPSSKAKK